MRAGIKSCNTTFSLLQGVETLTLSSSTENKGPTALAFMDRNHRDGGFIQPKYHKVLTFCQPDPVPALLGQCPAPMHSLVLYLPLYRCLHLSSQDLKNVWK